MQHINTVEVCNECGKSHKTGVILNNAGFVYYLGYSCLSKIVNRSIKNGKTIDAVLIDVKKKEKLRAAKNAE